MGARERLCLRMGDTELVCSKVITTSQPCFKAEGKTAVETEAVPVLPPPRSETRVSQESPSTARMETRR